MTLWEVAERIRAKDVSPVEVVKDVLEKIEAQNPTLNAFITVIADGALEDAKKAEQEAVEGEFRGPLHGIPVGVKDIIYTAGIRTTMGSNIFSSFVPEEDATVVSKLKTAGAILVGKLNTHEFAYGPTGDRSAFGAVRNPHDTRKMTGGSSSGSAASVAAHMCFAALGTDTGGSVRIPASCCGVVGIKPTYGRISKHGVFPLSPSLDHVGPLTQTVRDNALMYDVLQGYDPNDEHTSSISAELVLPYLAETRRAKIGIPANGAFQAMEDSVARSYRDVLRSLEAVGVEIVEIELPELDFVAWAQPILQKSEVYVIHETWLVNSKELYDKEVYERLLGSREPRGFEYVKALQAREKIAREWDEALRMVDALLIPTLPILPPDLGKREMVVNDTVQDVRTQLLKFTHPFNYTGQPSLSMPIGSEAGLPIGMQVIAPRFRERQLYQVAEFIEQMM